ncbi:MAG: T9SS type A sorting domain-containing protein [Ferruginibacter sp.]
MKQYLLFVVTVISFATTYGQHAPGYVDSTLENQSWDGANWVPSTNKFFYYHPSDSLYYNSITKAWNPTRMAYDINQNQDLVTYNASHKIQQNLQQMWITNQAAWRNTNLLLYTYDANNNLTNYTTQVWDTTLSVWVNSTQGLSMYDNNNNNTQGLSQYWNARAGAWRNSSLKNYTFDGSNRLVQSIRQSWDTTNNVWINVQKDTLQYKSADTTYGFSQTWDAANYAWLNNQEAINAFDVSGNNTYSFSFGWNNTTKVYDSAGVQQFIYNTNNELIEERLRNLSSASGNHYDFTYDSFGNPITFIFYVDVLQRAHSWDISFSINAAKIIYTWKHAESSLPVTLLNFSGKPVGNTTQLQWSTATENNSSYFAVQRSADGNNFQPIGKVTSAGNSNLIHNYTFTDDGPKINSINYYRLKQVDKDGHFVYSKIVTVSYNRQILVRVFPNPAKENVLIDVKGIIPGNYHINLSDVNGKVVLSQTRSIATGQSPIIISLNNKAEGVYFFEMRDIMNHVIAKQIIVKQ